MLNPDKFIINAAITGMIPKKADNPAIPVVPDEIISEAVRCYNAGASILHVHARDENQDPTTNPAVFQAIYRGIRAACPDLLISGTTSGRLVHDVRLRMSGLGQDNGIKPEFGSLTLGSMNFRTTASVNDPDTIRTLALEMKRTGIKPELEVFNASMAEYAGYMLNKGILEGPQYANILLGSLGTLSASAKSLVNVTEALPKGVIWAATGIGRNQFKIQSIALAMGGHVRAGLEDNLWMDDGRIDLATNVRLIDRLVTLAAAMGRTPATPQDVRNALNLPQSR